MALATRIAAVSVAAAELHQIRQAFETIRSQLPRPWLWTSELEADVLLIDVDSVHGHMDWLRLQHGDRTLVSLTQGTAIHDDLVLVRPVTAAGLLATLKRAGEAQAARNDPVAASPLQASPDAAAGNGTGVPAEPVQARSELEQLPLAAAAAAPPTAEGTAPAATPDERTLAPSAEALSLVEYFSPAVLPQPSRLALRDAPALTVDVAADCYYGPLTLKPLLPYCMGDIARDAWEPVSAAVMQGLRSAGGGQPLARLVWLQALASSNGQLLPGLDLNARYKLARWPLIEREYPRHFRIATIMIKGPATLTEIADQSGAALADVIDFVNAYSVSGFVESEPTASAPPMATPAASGLLARLRARARMG